MCSALLLYWSDWLFLVFLCGSIFRNSVTFDQLSTDMLLSLTLDLCGNVSRKKKLRCATFADLHRVSAPAVYS